MVGGKLHFQPKFTDLWPWSLTYKHLMLCRNILLLLSDLPTTLHYHWTFLAKVICENSIFGQVHWPLTLMFDLLPYLLCRDISLIICDVPTKLHHQWKFLDDVIGKYSMFTPRSLTFDPDLRPFTPLPLQIYFSLYLWPYYQIISPQDIPRWGYG